MKTTESLVAKVADGIWIGNAVVSNLHFAANDISAVVKLDTGVVVDPSVDCFTYALPDTELLQEEYPRVIAKLKTICDIISDMRAVGRNIIIQCEDGKNKSAIVAAFYLTRNLGQQRDVVIQQLSAVYFSPKQITEDAAERVRAQKIANGEEVPPLTAEELAAQSVRRGRQALSNQSFRKIVKLP